MACFFSYQEEERQRAAIYLTGPCYAMHARDVYTVRRIGRSVTKNVYAWAGRVVGSAR